MSPEAAEPSAASTFELLAEASTQVPDWLDAQRRPGLSSDPATSFAILILTLFVSTMFTNALFGALRGASTSYSSTGQREPSSRGSPRGSTVHGSGGKTSVSRTLRPPGTRT